MSRPVVASAGARARPGRALPLARAASAVPALLLGPGLAHACVECRQRALDAVFGDGFLATLALLLLPIPLVLAAAIALGRGAPGQDPSTGRAPGRGASAPGPSEGARPAPVASERAP
jgi:hypothetical protein